MKNGLFEKMPSQKTKKHNPYTQPHSYISCDSMRKKAEIKVKIHRQKKRIPQQFSILVQYNNRTKMAHMRVKPDVPTDKVQNVLRTILTLLDKSYPEEPEKSPSYIA